MCRLLTRILQSASVPRVRGPAGILSPSLVFSYDILRKQCCCIFSDTFSDAAAVRIDILFGLYLCSIDICYFLKFKFCQSPFVRQVLISFTNFVAVL